jgi:hypothetical protein
MLQFLESADQLLGVAVPDLFGDFGDRQLGFEQQPFDLSDPVFG